MVRRHANTSSARATRVAGEDDGVRLQHVDHVEAVGQDDADLAQVGGRSLDDLARARTRRTRPAASQPARRSTMALVWMVSRAKPSTTLTAPSAALALRVSRSAARRTLALTLTE